MTSDAHSSCKIRDVVKLFKNNNLKNHFGDKYYGDDINVIAFFLICRDSKLNLRQRIKFDNESKSLNIDIMLDLNLFSRIPLKEKFDIVKSKLLIDTQKSIKKFNFKEFESNQFIPDFISWLDKLDFDID